MKKISPKTRRKANLIYNQCVIYLIAASAISLAFIIPMKTKKPSAPVIPESLLTVPANMPQIAVKEQPAPKAELPIAKEEPKKAVQQVEVKKLLIPIQNKAEVQLAAPSVLTHQFKIDHQFLAKMEGTVLKGYVPLPKTTKSGVTIGRGFDLGQMLPKEFNQLPITPALKVKLRPYVGLKKFKAVAFLKSHPLTINASELEELNQISSNKILIPLEKAYNKVSSIPFNKLPSQAQTALFSFAYQYGAGFMYKSGAQKKLWQAYVHQNWNQVVSTLHSFKQYSPRRRQEAQLIHSIR